MTYILSAINLYPVKSLAGIAVNSWPVVKTGLQYDRQWMLVDNDGQFLSQRRVPKMALIKTAITAGELVLSAEGKSDLVLPLVPTSTATINVTIWHDSYAAQWVSSEADRWLNEILGFDCHLVYQPLDTVRSVDRQYAYASDQTTFSDGFPFLLVSENSLVVLNQAMQLDFAMARFRPNLVVAGCPAYDEDSWRQIRIGGIGFRLPKPCSRCAVTTIDPITTEIGKEPLATLNRLRKWQNKVYFGQNALHDSEGWLAVGDSVVIGAAGAMQPPLG
jgi:uncharacterized protein